MATTTTPLQEAEARYAPLRLAVERRHAEFMNARTVVRAARTALRQAGEEAEEARSHHEALRADAEVRAIVGHDLPDLIAAVEIQVEVAEAAFNEARQERARLQVESTPGLGLSADFDYASTWATPDRVESASRLYPAAVEAEAHAQAELDAARARLQGLTSQVDATLRRRLAEAARADFEAQQRTTRKTQRSAVRRFLDRVAV